MHFSSLDLLLTCQVIVTFLIITDGGSGNTRSIVERYRVRNQKRLKWKRANC